MWQKKNSFDLMTSRPFKILRSRLGLIIFFKSYCLPPKTKTYIRKALIWHIGELNRTSGHKSTALFRIFWKYTKGGPLEKKKFSFLLNASFYSERSYETISMPFGGLRLLKCLKWANFKKFWKNSENMQRGDP